MPTSWSRSCARKFLSYLPMTPFSSHTLLFLPECQYQQSLVVGANNSHLASQPSSYCCLRHTQKSLLFWASTTYKIHWHWIASEWWCYHKNCQSWLFLWCIFQAGNVFTYTLPHNEHTMRVMQSWNLTEVICQLFSNAQYHYESHLLELW